MATSIFKHNFPQTARLQKAADTADYIIGLDLHKKTTAICVVDTRNPNQPEFQRKRLKNIELLEKIDSFKGEKIVVSEAAFGWFPLREALESFEDITFITLDARKTSAWIESSGIKNDKIDAEVLAYACLHEGINRLAVHQPSPEAKENFKLINLRDKIVRQRTVLKNQLKSLDQDYDINPYTGEKKEKSELIKEMQDLLLDQLNCLEDKIQTIEQKIKELSKDDEVVSLLMTIPGIGFRSAFALRWKMEDIERFEKSANLSSYFGFGVRQRQSGETLIKGRIAKTGNSLIRKLLVQGAQVIRYKRPDLLQLYFPSLAQEENMKDWKHANKVTIALARKILVFVYHVWKNKQKFSLDEYRQRREQSSNIPAVSSKTTELENLLGC